MAGSADLDEAINTAWDASGLTARFTALWEEIDTESYPALNDQEATPGQPFPFCVFEKGKFKTLSRMSREGLSKWEIREVPVSFHVFAAGTFRTHYVTEFSIVVTGASHSSKEIAADLAAEIMKVFGGHPRVSPTHRELSLANGNHLQTQYQNDFGVRTEDDQYEWVINYNFLLDVPVMV